MKKSTIAKCKDFHFRGGARFSWVPILNSTRVGFPIYGFGFHLVSEEFYYLEFFSIWIYLVSSDRQAQVMKESEQVMTFLMTFLMTPKYFADDCKN